MKAAAQVIFRGRVQGVFFRANTQEKAQNRGITGWVRNMDDGGVEAFFEGDEEQVRRLIDDIEGGEGMGAARVDEKQVRWLRPTGYSDFDILR
jgi:acylphosphatase